MKKTKKLKITRINEELSRIKAWYSEIDENQLAMIEPLLQNAAFMRCTLDDLQDDINNSGATDSYQNGENQHGMKQAAALQAYNSLLKNYVTTVKVLASYLPRMNRVAVFPYAFQVKEKTVEEQKEEIRQAEIRSEKIRAEIAVAAEKQKRDREEWAKRKQVKSN